MNRRTFLSAAAGIASLAAGTTLFGCRGRQVAHVLDDEDNNMVGSHDAGAETYTRLVEQSVSNLLGREVSEIQLASHSLDPHAPNSTPNLGVGGKRICFVGVENKSQEDLGDFREQLYQLIDGEISRSGVFQPVSRRFVDAGLGLTRFRPDDLIVPANRREFAAVMEQEGASFDYLMFATLTSGTTTNNRDYQRDYLLTLELMDIHTGDFIKEDAKIRKGYHQSRIGKIRNYNPFTR